MSEVEHFATNVETERNSTGDLAKLTEKLKQLTEKERTWQQTLNQDEIEIKNLEDRLATCSNSRANSLLLNFNFILYEI